MKNIQLDINQNSRIIAISDVHGHKDLLESLIHKLDLKDDDVLIILGDFINRGINSLETYNYIRTIDQRKHTYVLKGNHESFIQRFLEDAERIGDLLDFLKKDYYETVVHSVVNERKESLEDYTPDTLYQLFKDHEVVDYFRSLPIFLETDEYIFVHGGYDDHLKEDHEFLKYDEYNKKGSIQNKTVVVGHWPASNLRSDIATNKPFFNDEKHIITIDGGVGIKATGELNALIIENNTFQTVSVNHFNEMVVKETYRFFDEPLVYINYPDYELEVLVQEALFSKCKHLKSGKVIHVFSELINDENQLTVDYINRFFDVKKGDIVEVCKIYESCVLVKYENEFGWLLKSQLMEAN